MAEELKFSILVCVYGNHKQFSNFLWTAYCQDYDDYEIVIVDNATPGAAIENIYKACPKKIKNKIKYHFIPPQDKKCRNITQGINLAAHEAKGKYLVIVADPNVLLSFNFLKTMDGIDNNTVMLSDISGDLKISPTGTYADEYSNGDPALMAEINKQLLEEMGWPADPLELKLIPGKHRMAPVHLTYDCYIVVLSKENFFKFGGYNENETSWGMYHELFVRSLIEKLEVKFLKGIRVIHQYHRVLKDDPI